MTVADVLDLQRRFVGRVLRDRGLDLDDLPVVARDAYVVESVLAAHSELSELLDEFSWKRHRAIPSRDRVVRSNVVEEAVDVLKYVLGVLAVWGVEGEVLEAAIISKSAVVEARYDQERRLRDLARSGRSVVAVDLDGVLAEYPEPWLAWLRRDLGVDVQTVEEARDLLADAYDDAKSRYRESGVKRTIPARSGARELVSALRGNGDAVVVLTARPVARVSRLWADTLDWIRLHVGSVDAILFDADKAVRVATTIPTLRAFVDDDADECRAVARLGVVAYHVGGAGETISLPRGGRVEPVDDLFDAIEALT